MHRVLTSLLALAWLTGAAAPGARLSWVRAPGAEACADAASVAAGVTKRLGYDPFARPPARVVEAIVERADGKWLARLYWSETTPAPGTIAEAGDPTGSTAPILPARMERTLASEAETCDALGPAAALAVALAIDPDAALRAPGTPPELPPEPAPIEQEAPRPDPRAWVTRPLVSVRALATRGTVPGEVAPGVALNVGSGITGPVSWAVGAVALPMQRTEAFGFALVGATAEACSGGAPHERVAVRACARVMGGALEAYVFPSEEVRSVAPGQYPWAAGAAAVRATALVAGPFVVEAELSAVVPITRQAFLLRGRADPVFREDGLGFQAAVGAGLALE